MEDDVAAAAAIVRSFLAGGLGFGFVTFLFGRAVFFLVAAGPARIPGFCAAVPAGDSEAGDQEAHASAKEERDEA